MRSRFRSAEQLTGEATHGEEDLIRDRVVFDPMRRTQEEQPAGDAVRIGDVYVAHEAARRVEFEYADARDHQEIAVG